MTTFSVKVNSTDVSSLVKQIEVWDKAGEGVGLFAVLFKDKNHEANNIIAAMQPLEIKVGNGVFLKGYVEDIFPVVDQEQSIHRELLRVSGRNFGMDMQNKLNEKIYPRQPVDDIIEDILTSSGCEVTYTSAGVMEEQQFVDAPPQTVLEALRRLCSRCNPQLEFYVDENKALQLFERGATSSGITLKSVADAQDNKIIEIPKAKPSLTREIVNYVIGVGPKVTDGYTEGNAEDYEAGIGGATISDEFSIVAPIGQSVASIEYYKNVASEIVIRLTFPKWNYDYLDFSEFWDETLSFWLRGQAHTPSQMSKWVLYMDLTDTSGNVIRFKWSEPMLEHQKWNQFSAPIGNAAQIGDDTKKGNCWYQKTGSTFTWLVNKIQIYSHPGWDYIWLDGLNMPIKMVSVAQSAYSQGIYKARKKPFDFPNVRTQVELDKETTAKLNSLAGANIISKIVADGNAGIISGVNKWHAGQKVTVNAPNDYFNNEEQVMLELYHRISENDVHGFDFVTEATVGLGSVIDQKTKEIYEDPKMGLLWSLHDRIAFLERKEERLKDWFPALPRPWIYSEVDFQALLEWLTWYQTQTDPLAYGADDRKWTLFGDVTVNEDDGTPALKLNVVFASLSYCDSIAWFQVCNLVFAAYARASFSGTNTADFRIGFNCIAGGVWFDYDCATQQLKAICRKGANQSDAIISGVTLTEYHQYSIEVSTSSCKFYVDGDLVATITTNIPTATDIPLRVLVEDVGNDGVDRMVYVKSLVVQKT